jgi:hypothetical protein
MLWEINGTSVAAQVNLPTGRMAIGERPSLRDGVTAARNGACRRQSARLY